VPSGPVIKNANVNANWKRTIFFCPDQTKRPTNVNTAHPRKKVFTRCWFCIC